MLHRHRRKNRIFFFLFWEAAAWSTLQIPMCDGHFIQHLKILTPSAVPRFLSKVALSGRPLLSLNVYRFSKLPTCQQRHIRHKKKKNTTTPHILDIKGGFYSYRKCFHHFKDVNTGAAWGSKRITYSALIKTNAISAYPPSGHLSWVGFSCRSWGQKSNSAQFI